MRKDGNIIWDYRNEINKPIVAGTLLLSEPFMQDPSFIRSTCLVVSHIPEDGTFGFVLDKVSPHKLSELIDIKIDKEVKVYFGGPVDLQSLFYLHNNNFNLTGAKKITENLYWGGDFDELLMKLESNIAQLDDIKFILGYSGWDGGQLRKEIIENSWIINSDYPLQISEANSKLWHNVLNKMGGVYKTFVTLPIDPNLN